MKIEILRADFNSRPSSFRNAFRNRLQFSLPRSRGSRGRLKARNLQFLIDAVITLELLEGETRARALISRESRDLSPEFARPIFSGLQLHGGERISAPSFAALMYSVCSRYRASLSLSLSFSLLPRLAKAANFVRSVSPSR